jgi:hypothetical protein
MKGRSYKLSLLGLAAVLFVAVFFLQGELNRQRADPRLGLTRVAPLENAPPVLAFTTVALGGFRGIIANALWIRANDLQDDGKYFEMVQLADWITKLEPTFTQVWLVQSWNMAYNISVKFSDPRDRWRWVQRGIELLRDDGLRFNPREALIYRELAWFFQHKMGANLDEAHMFYKAEWANAMGELLGGGRPHFEELLNPTTDEAKQRVEVLRKKYKMDPAMIKKVDDRYGPIDWRLPETHAIYWAAVGLEKSKKKDLITLRRVIYQSMQMAAFRGRIIGIEPNGMIRFGPNLAIVPQANASYEKMIEDDEEMRHAIVRAHKNFLREIIYLLYSYDRNADARHWFEEMRRKYPDTVPPGQTMEEFALERLTENARDANQDRMKIMIEGYIRRYYIDLVNDLDDEADRSERVAGYYLAYYMNKIRGQERRLGLVPINETKKDVLNRLLEPQTGLPPELRARLRTKLRMPAEAPPAPPSEKP